MNDQAIALIDLLSLQTHPEGGFYREAFRSALELSGLPQGGTRNASTAIYFLLPSATFSAFHRVRSDEVWHFYDGGPLEIHTIDEAGEYSLQILGREYSQGQRPQVVVPAGVWQAARPQGELFSFCGCTVAPGFDFSDFEMPSREELLSRFPKQRSVLVSLTRL